MTIKEMIKEKIGPFLAGLSSALVMILAFFIPSLQDQWDRHESRKIIDQYESLGNDFYKEEKYDMAEQAYQKAFELSDSRRLDIETKRLDAKINRINMDPHWGAAPPEELEEIDFQYLLHMQKGKEKEKERIATLNSYGLFLVSLKKNNAAEASFLEAVRLDSSNAMAYVNLGNLYDQRGNKSIAETFYLKAIALDNDNPRAHYNLALLYKEQGKLADAIKQLAEAVRSDPSDADAKQQYDELIKQMPAEANK